MYRIFGIVALAALGLTAGAVDAFSQTYYAGVRGGYDYPYESDLRANGISGRDASLDSTGIAAAAFGFEWVDGWRVEGELSWRRSDFDKIDNAPVTAGDAETYAAMLNMYYGMRAKATVNPYLGGGIGIGRLSVGDLSVGGATVDDSGEALAWQGIAGVDFALSEAWRLSLEYRYFVMRRVMLADSLGMPFKVDYRSSAALLGIRVGF